MLNTLFNPFERERIFYPPDSTPLSKALYHSGGLAVGYGGLGLVLRKVIQAHQGEKTQKTMKKLKAFSSARYPTLSIDPYLNDEAQEKELENLGVPELPVLKAANDTSTMHMALAAAAVVAAGYGGWRLADYHSDKERGEQLDDRILKTRNLIDKMVFDEIQRTRGPQKAAAGRDLEKESSWVENIKSAWWVWVAAAFASGKHYADKSDPNRKRLKELEDIAEDRSKVYDAPVLLDESSLTDAPGLSGSPPSRSIASVPVQGVKTKTPVDASDPYAAIL